MRIAEEIKTVDQSSVKSFVKFIGEEGRTFCPATFKTASTDISRKKENFEQMQLFALDFDKGISFPEVKERMEKYELPVLFAYDTFSSVDNNKFRAVFLNNVPVNDVGDAEAVIQALMAVFPECDTQCRDVSRIFYGRKRLFYFNESLSRINIESLFRNMAIYLRDRYGDTHYKRKIKEFAEKNGITLNKSGFIDISREENKDIRNCSELQTILFISNQV